MANGRLGRDIKLSVAYGLALAVIYSTFAGLIRLVGGADAFHDPPFSMLRVTGAYFAGGVVSGVIVGVMLPLGKRKWGAALVGFVGAIPVLFALMMLIDPPSRWFNETLATVLITAAVLGPLCGVGAWHVHQRVWLR